MKNIFATLAFAIILPTQAWAAKPLALVYQGDGACIEDDADCAQSAAEVAKKAGFSVKFVNPAESNETLTAVQIQKIFTGAKVWVQPGGMANEAFENMSQKLRAALKKFISDGGGYVGFCAGAFMATEWIGHGGGEGLGILAGSTNTYHKGFSLAPVLWQGELRQIYFEGGPYFYGFEEDKNVEVMATYETGAAASVRTLYGKGRVWVTGLHPEAPLKWTKDDEIDDPDGIEQHLAADMIRWAGGRKLSKKQR